MIAFVFYINVLSGFQQTLVESFVVRPLVYNKVAQGLYNGVNHIAFRSTDLTNVRSYFRR
jgi:hypothetical protein